jgi:hypothetical protein
VESFGSFRCLNCLTNLRDLPLEGSAVRGSAWTGSRLALALDISDSKLQALCLTIARNYYGCKKFYGTGTLAGGGGGGYDPLTHPWR